MTPSTAAAVERATPPAVVTRVGNPALTWLLSGQRLGIRINVDRVPTDDELVDAARREHLRVVELHLEQPR